MSDRLTRASVVGMGEVGRRLAAAFASAEVGVRPVTRAAGWEEALADREAPLVVCVREESLPEALERLAGADPGRLAFVQNGWVRPLLASAAGCTRGLVWFTSKREYFRVLRPSVLAGPLAGSLAAALERGGVPAVAVGEIEFAPAEAEKMGFNCVVGLPLAVHGLTLAEYLEREEGEARAVFDEALEVCCRALGAAAADRAWEAFVGSCGPIGWVRAAEAKALEYRNGAVVRLARELGLEAPANRRLLAAVGFPV